MESLSLGFCRELCTKNGTRFITLSLASFMARKQAPAFQTDSHGLMSQISNGKHGAYLTALKSAAEYILLHDAANKQ